MRYIKIYDITGKLIEDINMDYSLTKQVDISSYEDGVYVLKAESIDGESLITKIVKTHKFLIIT